MKELSPEDIARMLDAAYMRRWALVVNGTLVRVDSREAQGIRMNGFSSCLIRVKKETWDTLDDLSSLE